MDKSKIALRKKFILWYLLRNGMSYAMNGFALVKWTGY